MSGPVHGVFVEEGGMLDILEAVQQWVVGHLAPIDPTFSLGDGTLGGVMLYGQADAAGVLHRCAFSLG
jgi:hypothetical protein